MEYRTKEERIRELRREVNELKAEMKSFKRHVHAYTTLGINRLVTGETTTPTTTILNRR